MNKTSSTTCGRMGLSLCQSACRRRESGSMHGTHCPPTTRRNPGITSVPSFPRPSPAPAPHVLLGWRSPTDTRPRGQFQVGWLIPSTHGASPVSNGTEIGESVPELYAPRAAAAAFTSTPKEIMARMKKWKEGAIRQYEKIIKLIKTWTVRRGKWGYWSKQLDPPPTDP